MKFWATVVGSIIVISAVITWLSMKGGAQAEPLGKKPVDEKSASEKKPVKVATDLDAPKFEWVSGGKIEWSTITFDAGDSPRDKERTVDIQFRNAGKAPLEISFRQISCDCLTGATLDGAPLRLGFRGPAVDPQKSATLRLSWKPTAKQLPDGAPAKAAEYTANFYTGDYRYSDLRIEIKTRLTPP